jgi:hypothetical protein
MELYRMGVFEKEKAASAAILLDGLEFSGVGAMRERVAELAKDTV